MLPAAQDADGRTYVIVGAPPAGTPFMAGLALSNNGQLYVNVTPSAPFTFVNGFQVSQIGELIADVGGGAPYGVFNGLMRSSLGVLLGTFAAPDATDVFIGGSRVTSTGLLCCTTALPP